MTRRTSGLAWPVAAMVTLALGSGSCRESATSTTAISSTASSSTASSTTGPSTAQVAPPAHRALFYHDATFFSAVRAAALLSLPDDDVAGAIIPHDWRGGAYIAWLFRWLADRGAADTVILIGPNHDNEGSQAILASELPWATAFGTVHPDHEVIDALIAEGLISVDEQVLSTEHSVAGIIPAIAYYLPGARVVPLIIRSDAGPEDAERLGRALASRLDGTTLLVAAVDFSHDLVSSAAQRNNAVTLAALRAGDSATLFVLDNRYLDSPDSLAVLMAAMESAGAGPLVVTADTNSAALRGDELAPTTSYVVGYYAAPAGSARSSTGLLHRGTVHGHQ